MTPFQTCDGFNLNCTRTDQTRADAFARMAKSRRVGVPTLATLVGPYGIPEEAFGEAAIRALLGENWSLSAEGDFVRPGTA
jgi:hypothetical protein